MYYLMITQKCADYARWRAVFDQHAEARTKAGIKTALVTRNMNDPNEVVILFECPDLERVHEYFQSKDLQDAHRRAGVLKGTTTPTFLKAAEPTTL